MAWKGNILRLNGLRNCIGAFGSSASSSNNISVSARHIKVSWRTYRTPSQTTAVSVCSIQGRSSKKDGLLNVNNYKLLSLACRRDCTTESGEVIEKKTQTKNVVTYEKLKDLIKKKEILLIDVREPKEIEQTGLMPGAINIPLTKLKNALSMDEERFQTVYARPKPKSTGDNFVFYGLSNIKSEAALELAHKSGYKKARHYPGGWQEWSKKESGSEDA